MKIIKKILGAITVLSFAFLLFIQGGTAFADTNFKTEIFAPFTYIEYKKLDSPVDVYTDDEITVLLEHNTNTNKQQLIVYKDGVYTTYSNATGNIDFDNIHHVKKFKDFLVLQDNYRPYVLNLKTGSYTELKDEDGNFIPCSYFGFNENYFVSLYNKTIEIFEIKDDNLTLSLVGEQTNASNGDIEVKGNYLFYFNDRNFLCRKNLVDGEIKEYDTEVNGEYLICNENYAFLSYDKGIKRINLESGEIVLSPAKTSFAKLGDIVSPKGMSFKDDFILVCDSNSNTVQGINIEDFSFTGYAIATTEPSDTRGSDKVIDITIFENKTYILDQTKIIITDGESITSVPYSVEGFLPNAITTNGELALLTSANKLVFINLKTGEIEKVIDQQFVCKTTLVDGEFFLLSSEIYNDFNGKLIKVSPTETTVYKLNINGISSNDLITSDVEGNLYVYVRNSKKVYVIDKTGVQTGQTYLGSITAIKMGVDLSGNVFLLNDNNQVEKISTDGESKIFSLTVPNNLPNAKANGMAMSFDKKEVFFTFNKEGFVLKTTELENENVIDLIASVNENKDYITTKDTVDIDQMKFGKIKDNKCVYYFNNEYLGYSKLDNQNYSVAGETQGYYILIGSELSLCKKEDFAFLDMNEFLKPVTNSVGYVSTPVSMYYHPVINIDSDYALDFNGKIRLEKNIKIELIKTFTFVGKENTKDFYLAKTVIDNKEFLGFVPANFIISSLAQNVETQDFVYKNLKPCKVFADQGLTTNLLTTEEEILVKVLTITEDYSQIEIEVDGTTYLGYVKDDCLINPANDNLRKVLIVGLIAIAVFIPSIFLLKKRKFD
ncbi:MAG: hypothetical protein E7342_00225 [Clostridiales bacterium]|nr:hypothetical protein [Clostridiales bacterium]